MRSAFVFALTVPVPRLDKRGGQRCNSLGVLPRSLVFEPTLGYGFFSRRPFVGKSWILSGNVSQFHRNMTLGFLGFFYWPSSFSLFFRVATLEGATPMV